MPEKQTRKSETESTPALPPLRKSTDPYKPANFVRIGRDGQQQRVHRKDDGTESVQSLPASNKRWVIS